MPEHILFLTGKLAENSLHRVLEHMNPSNFTYEVRQMGISVAALMTNALIERRLQAIEGTDRVLLPGRFRGDLQQLSARYGVKFERGPDELKDLPGYFNHPRFEHDLSRYEVQLFAEIVDAPRITIEQIVRQAEAYRADGADVIDIGCLPDTPFAHLAETVQTLKQEGFAVSVDSLVTKELLTGGQAGADYLLSLQEDTLWVCDEVPSTPILIGKTPADLDSLFRAMERMNEKQRTFYADPILDPIQFGFTDSIGRYQQVRVRFPNARILMGIGNLTELTHADTSGMNALLMGIISELNINAVLTTQVSGHCRSVVREIDLARRIMHAAKEHQVLPQHIDCGLIGLHELKPHSHTPAEIRELADAVRDPNFRVQVSAEGIYIYNRDGLHQATDPYELFPLLKVENDGAHAFYLGLELARAQIAWQLGKRYEQDEELRWGCMVKQQQQDLKHFAPERSTLKVRKQARKKNRAKPPE